MLNAEIHLIQYAIWLVGSLRARRTGNAFSIPKKMSTSMHTLFNLETYVVGISESE